ncbi:hypothetical protein BY458DRAFT_496539 [Sporodiniella umbellata]|nr:hypothetical protein BY458DRAFT_496539 [Sporodiniella umbellata]
MESDHESDHSLNDTTPSWTLRVINPDNDSEHSPTSIPSTPELQPVNRKMSKVLVESSFEFEPVRPLEPLFSIPPNNEHLLPSESLAPPELPEHRTRERLLSIASITPSLAPSKYAKASFSLTNNPDAIKLYRSMALKTKDPGVQLTYAKYLLEIADLYNQNKSTQISQFSLQRPLSRMSFRSSMDSRRSSINSVGIDPNYRPSIESPSVPSIESAKQKMLQDEGIRWIKKLANRNVGEAAYLWGSWLDQGLYGLKKNTAKALKYYEIGAKEKVPEAMFAVGRYHEKEQDYMTSFQMYEDAASMGLVEALYRIAMIHLNGEFGSRQNVMAAIQLLVKACEKSSGSCPEAPYTLGLLLLNEYPSINIPNELVQSFGGTFGALSYLDCAAEMGLCAAQYKLGRYYEQRPDISKAFQYYQMASHKEPLAMLALSRIYNQGIQVPQEQIDEQKLLFEHDESQWTKTNTRDEDAAFHWCRMAASHRLPDAYYLLGWYYEMGMGVPRNYKQAYRYYHKASKANHLEARNRVEILDHLVKHKKIENKHRGSGQCHIM